MDRDKLSSRVVPQTMGVESEDRTAWTRFEQLYRSSRDDVYAYVFTLLRDRPPPRT